jgi:GAF domain-containing protein
VKPSSYRTRNLKEAELGPFSGAAQDTDAQAKHNGFDASKARALLQAEGLLRVRNAQQAAYWLVQTVPCFVGGLLLANERHGQIVLACARPVDDLFLEAVQRRVLDSYRLYAGPATIEPEMCVTVHGDRLSGPYELPRAMLTMPILFEGRVAGMFIVASVFRNAFRPEDLCAMSILAARMAASLHAVCLT